MYIFKITGLQNFTTKQIFVTQTEKFRNFRIHNPQRNDGKLYVEET